VHSGVAEISENTEISLISPGVDFNNCCWKFGVVHAAGWSPILAAVFERVANVRGVVVYDGFEGAVGDVNFVQTLDELEVSVLVKVQRVGAGRVVWPRLCS